MKSTSGSVIVLLRGKSDLNSWLKTPRAYGADECVLCLTLGLIVI